MSGSGVHRLALVTAGATLGLIMAGGLVTTTGAGLAVPDWPTTFGYPMFLFPWSGMVGGVLVEHGHRLLGSLVGLLTVALAAALWLRDRRPLARVLGVAAVALVSIQGLLGGLRVVWLADELALVHGCLAHVFFGLTVVVVVVTSDAWSAGAGAPGSDGLSRAAFAAAGLVLGQIVLGAFTTHRGWAALHVGGAVVTTLGLGALMVALGRRPGPARAGRLHALLGLQLLVGLLAYVGRFTGLAVPGGELAGVALPVVHRALAALLLGETLRLALATRPRPALERAGRPAGARPTGAPREAAA